MNTSRDPISNVVSLNKKRRRALIALVLLVVGGWLVFAKLESRYHHRIFSTQDLFQSLYCYMLSHDGRLPPSVDALIDVNFASRSIDGAITMNRETLTACAGKIYGEPIENINDFHVQWGLDLRTLIIKNDRVTAADGHEILPFITPYGEGESRVFSVALVREAQAKKAD